MKKTFSFLDNLSLNKIALKTIDECIKITLGPEGKNALVFLPTEIIQYISNGSVLINFLSFPFSSGTVLVKLLAQAAKKTSTVAGDGSTTTLLLSCELIENSFKYLTAGYNSLFLSNGLKKSAYFFLENLSIYSLPIDRQEDLFAILKTALGKKIQTNLLTLFKDILPYFHRDGLILVEENILPMNQIEKIQGVEINRGFASSYFVNDLKNFQTFYEKPYICIANRPISSMGQLHEILEYSKKNNRPLVIIAEEIGKEVLSTLILNTMKKKITVSVIKYTAIQFLKTGILEDVALLTYTNYSPLELTEEVNNSFSIKDLGQAEKVIITKEKTTFFISKFGKIVANRRINELNRELLESESEYEKNIFQTRIARLSGNITKIKLGKTNEFELQDVKKKVETLFLTVKSALEEGCLPGGGSSFYYLRNEFLSWSFLNLIGEEYFAAQILLTSFSRPFKELTNTRNILYQQNLLKSVSISFFLTEKIEKLGYPYSYDILKKEIGNSFTIGLIDSTKAVRASIWNAITIVSTLLTSE